MANASPGWFEIFENRGSKVHGYRNVIARFWTKQEAEKVFEARPQSAKFTWNLEFVEAPMVFDKATDFYDYQHHQKVLNVKSKLTPEEFEILKNEF